MTTTNAPANTNPSADEDADIAEERQLAGKKAGALRRAFTLATKAFAAFLVAAPVAYTAYTATFYTGRGEKLTDGEKNVMENILGDEIKTEKVRKHLRRPNGITFHVTRFWIGTKRAMNLPLTSHIDFYGAANYSQDFSKENTDLFGLYVHEMIHVYQNQTDMNYKDIGEYPYTIDASTKFDKMGIEQQAALGEDYARYFLHVGRDTSLYYTGADKDTPEAFEKIRAVFEARFPTVARARLHFEATGKLPKAVKEKRKRWGL